MKIIELRGCLKFKRLVFFYKFLKEFLLFRGEGENNLKYLTTTVKLADSLGEEVGPRISVGLITVKFNLSLFASYILHASFSA